MREALPYSPLTHTELNDRAQAHAFMCVGALNQWASREPRGDRPEIAIEHAREASALLDAAAAR